MDEVGVAYLTGRTASTDFPLADALQAAHAGGSYDAFVTALNPDGASLAYSTYLGGSGSGEGFGMAVDSAGGAIVAGHTGSTDFLTAGPSSAPRGARDVFIARLAPDESELDYSLYLGGEQDAFVAKIRGAAGTRLYLPVILKNARGATPGL